MGRTTTKPKTIGWPYLTWSAGTSSPLDSEGQKMVALNSTIICIEQFDNKINKIHYNFYRSFLIVNIFKIKIMRRLL